VVSSSQITEQTALHLFVLESFQSAKGNRKRERERENGDKKKCEKREKKV
jgi:hypothetical protein